jgi:hypothetical protein
MSGLLATKSQQEVWQTLREVNKAWSQGRLDELRKYFHKDMVIVAPGFQQRVNGRDDCIKTFEEFVGRVTNIAQEEAPLSIDVCGDTAIVVYEYEVRYNMDGESHSDTGQDMFIFTREGHEWMAIWRTMFPAPPTS